MTKVYALKYHYLKLNKTEDFIAIRSDDGVIFINIPLEKIKEALKEFETGEEVNVNL